MPNLFDEADLKDIKSAAAGVSEKMDAISELIVAIAGDAFQAGYKKGIEVLSRHWQEAQDEKAKEQ